jgi:hypothetical protein
MQQFPWETPNEDLPQLRYATASNSHRSPSAGSTSAGTSVYLTTFPTQHRSTAEKAATALRTTVGDPEGMYGRRTHWALHASSP